MNIQIHDPNSGQGPWPRLPAGDSSGNESESTIRQQYPEDDESTPRQRSLSPQPTTTQGPPPLPPSPPSLAESSPELYGPNRYFGEPTTPRKTYQTYNARAPRAQVPEPVVRFDEAQLAMLAAGNAQGMAQSMKDDLALAAGKVTPGVDDSPYIQYALQALTRNQSDPVHQYHFPSDSSNSSPRNYGYSQRIQDEEMGFSSVPRPATARTAADRTPRVLASPLASMEERNKLYMPPMPQTQSPALSPNLPASAQWVPVTRDMRGRLDPESRTYPPLTFKPRILRPFSMMILMTLCLLMIAAHLFCAVYSDLHSGLTPYEGSIYSGTYFVFRILPQLLAAVIVIYAQCIMSASLRVLPFMALASDDPRGRYLALFQSLYPKAFLWPTLVGPWQFKLYSVVCWLTYFTIPLQSAAFTCITGDEKWIWAAVQGVAWTLIVLYILLLLSVTVLMVFWFGKWTGLAWDVRSVAHLIPLLNRSNSTNAFRRLDAAEPDYDIKAELHDRWFDRLGYWRTEDMLTGGIWYALGTESSKSDQEEKTPYDISGQRASYDLSINSREFALPNLGASGLFKYLPWCLRSGPLGAFATVAGALLVAFLVVCFLPRTKLEDGFSPLLSARPEAGAFSAANFLYCFLPALLGMVLFLLFQSLDQALRITQPWAEMTTFSGSVARKSILADYAACLPFHSTKRAISNGHWRVAVTSIMATLFIAIPVLSGGLFMALTTPEGQVLMFPNMPVFGVLLAFLLLYVGCVSLLLPRRRQFLLPRPVTSIAGIVSLCSAEELTQDAAFRSVRSGRDLEDRLGMGSGAEESVWFFGLAPGRDEQRLSVRRLNRFTEKRITPPRLTRFMP